MFPCGGGADGVLITLVLGLGANSSVLIALMNEALPTNPSFHFCPQLSLIRSGYKKNKIIIGLQFPAVNNREPSLLSQFLASWYENKQIVSFHVTVS